MKKLTRFLSLLILFTLSILAQDSKENSDFKLALGLYNDKLYDLALEQFRNFINLYPNSTQSIDAKFYIGLIESKLGKHDDARLTFQNFALTYPNHPKAVEAWLNVAEACLAVSNYKEAAVAFERVKTFFPKSKFAPDALIKAADNYDKIGDKANTRRVLNILLQEYKTEKSSVARIRLAELYYDEKQYEKARRESKAVLDEGKDASLNSRALFVMGKSLIELEKYSEAENALSEIIKKFKSSEYYYESLYLLGKARKQVGNIQDALTTWQSIVSDNSNASPIIQQDICIEIGDVFSSLGNYKDAVTYFEKASKIKGARKIEACYKAGLASERSGELIRAAQNYSSAYIDTTEATNLSVNNKALMLGAYKSAVFTKNYPEAFRLILFYQNKYTTDETLPRLLLDGANIAYNEVNDYKKAIDFCEDIINGFPKSEYIDDAIFLKGKSQMKIEDMSSAVSSFEMLIKKYPCSEYIPEAQKNIFFITNFYRNDKDAGVLKLALLVGDVIAQKSRGNLSYRLAEIYFSDLKDYRSASEQYSNALKLDIEEELKPTALFKLGNSFELLGIKEGEKTAEGKEYISKAIRIYDSLYTLYPANEFAQKALTSQYKLRVMYIEKPEQLTQLLKEFEKKSINNPERDKIVLSIGEALTNFKNFDSAAEIYRKLIKKYSDKESASFALFRLGEILDKTMMKDSAIHTYEIFVKENPNHYKSAEAVNYLVQSASSTDQVVKSLMYLDMISKQYYYTKFNENVDILKGDAYFKSSDYKSAYDLYKRAWKKMASNYLDVKTDIELERSIAFKLGVVNEKLGNMAETKKWYREYIAMDQNSERAAQVYYSLAKIAKEENKNDIAIQYMQQASRIQVKLGSQVTPAAFEAAEMLFKEEKYDEAIEKYKTALLYAKNDTVKKYIEARIIIANMRADNLKDADIKAAEFSKVYKSSASYNELAEFDFERGKYYFRKSNSEKALEYFRKVMRSYSKSNVVPDVMYWIARVYEVEGRISQAIGLYDSLLNKYPNHEIIPRVRLNLGNAYYNMEQLESAAKQYKIILENEKTSSNIVPLAMSNLAMTYKQAGLFDAALELTRKYIEQYPDDPEIIDKRIDIGVIYQKLGYYDQSVLHLQSLIDAGNSAVEAELRYYIGEAYYYKGEYQQAIIEFLKVPYLASRREKIDWISAAYYMAGQSYEKMSKYDQAITMYKQIIDRKDTDGQFKTAAQKEIKRVKNILGKN